MRVAVGDQRRASGASTDDQQRLLEDVEAHHKRRKQLELELEQMAAEFEDEGERKLRDSQTSADPLAFLCECSGCAGLEVEYGADGGVAVQVAATSNDSGASCVTCQADAEFHELTGELAVVHCELQSKLRTLVMIWQER